MTENTPKVEVRRPRHWWPETEPLSEASFVSYDGAVTWIPLCDRCRSELTYAFTPWQSHRCDNCGWSYLIWAEDWPDYDDEED